MLYFASAYYNFDGAVMITASHLPKEYNGLKFCRKKARALFYGGGLESIEFMIKHGVLNKSKTNGSIKNKNIKKDYERFMIKNIKKNKINIIVDTCHMMGYLDFKILKKISNAKGLFLNVNNNFPDHGVDPTIENNVSYLKKEVVKNKADLGIGPDGDGDRYFFIDEKGEIVRQEILRGIMARIALKENPGATVCYDIRPGRITKDMIEEAGGKASVTRVGHSLIKEQMLKENAVFGGESSGHYFYKFMYGTFEAPIVLTLKFLEYLSEQNKPLSEVIAPYQKYFHSGEINTKVPDVKAKIEEIKQKYSDGQQSFLDGITIEYPDYWFNVRPSNTEPLLRLNLEARSKELMEQKRDEVLSAMKS